MLLKYESSKSVEELRNAIEEKAKAKAFGVMTVHEVSKILESKGVPISYQCVIVEVCSPRHASQVLQKNPSISTAMPCRISIFNEGDKSVVMTMSPMAMLEMFNEPQLEDVAKEVEKLMKEIIEEAI